MYICLQACLQTKFGFWLFLGYFTYLSVLVWSCNFSCLISTIYFYYFIINYKLLHPHTKHQVFLALIFCFIYWHNIAWMAADMAKDQIHLYFLSFWHSQVVLTHSLINLLHSHLLAEEKQSDFAETLKCPYQATYFQN